MVGNRRAGIVALILGSRSWLRPAGPISRRTLAVRFSVQSCSGRRLSICSRGMGFAVNESTVFSTEFIGVQVYSHSDDVRVSNSLAEPMSSGWE